MVDTFNAKLQGFDTETGATTIDASAVKDMQERDIRDILIALIKKVAEIENILTKNNIK